MAMKPHVLAIPYPAQGHAAPLMKLSARLAAQGINVTFVITQLLQAKISAEDEQYSCGRITVVSIPDGLQSHEEQRQHPEKMTRSMLRVMPGCLKNMIEKINQSNDRGQIKCVIADVSVGGWALDVADQMGIAKAAFIPYGLASFAMGLHVPKLIEDGYLDVNGNATSEELILLPGETVAWRKDEFTWTVKGEPNLQKFFFDLAPAVIQSVKNSNWFLSNSIYELDSAISHQFQNILTIGPIIASNHLELSDINLWPVDSSCLSWLDKQATGSVIYVAFGSAVTLSQEQLEELSLGLESLNQPFLWVVRPDLMNGTLAKFPDGFLDRVSSRGKIVGWASQEKVLGHRSVACFLSHCGTSSVMEGLSTGVPFLCWPHLAEQWHNRSYICDAWKIGYQLCPNENGIVTRQEIQRKTQLLLSDDGITENSLKLKEIARKSLAEGGSSFRNLKSFASQIIAL